MSNDHLVVTTDIPVGDPGRGVYAARVGDRVPAHLVKANGWDEYVAKPGTKAADAATPDIGGDAPAATAKGGK